MPSAIRFSHGSAAVSDGRRPFSCLNFSARLASSMASSALKLHPLGGDHFRNLFQPFLAHGFGENRVGFAKWIDAVNQINIQFGDTAARTFSRPESVRCF